MNHLRSGKCESCMMVPEVALNWYSQARQAHWLRSGISHTFLLSQCGQITLPLGQRMSSRKSLHLSSFGNLSIRRIRLKEVVSVMNQNSKKKRKRRLPHNTIERPDSEIMERIFGKRVKRELDKIAGKPEAGAGGKHLKPR